MSQNSLENQLTKTNEEGLLIKLFSIIIGHKRLQAPAKSHPTGRTRLRKKDDWIQKRLHRKAASSSSSPETENMHLTIGSVLLCGVLRKEKMSFFSLRLIWTPVAYRLEITTRCHRFLLLTEREHHQK
jgi:hypothetical protein